MLSWREHLIFSDILLPNHAYISLHNGYQWSLPAFTAKLGKANKLAIYIQQWIYHPAWYTITHVYPSQCDSDIGFYILTAVWSKCQPSHTSIWRLLVCNYLTVTCLCTCVASLGYCPEGRGVPVRQLEDSVSGSIIRSRLWSTAIRHSPNEYIRLMQVSLRIYLYSVNKMTPASGPSLLSE